MALCTGSPKNGILPIGVRQSAVAIQVREQFGGNTFPRVGTHAVRVVGRNSRIGIQIGVVMTVLGKLRKLVGIHHIQFLRYILYAIITVILYLHFFRLPLFGSNNNNTIGTAAAINSCRRSILQHFHRLYIIIIKIGEATFYRYTVNDVKRIATGIDSTDTTHADTDIAFRITAWSSHLHSRHLSRQCLTKIRSGCFGNILRLHRRYGSRYVALLLHAISHNHYFLQQFTVLFQNYIGKRFVPCRKSPCLVAYKRDDNFRFLGNASQCIFSVNIRNRSQRSAFHGNARTNYRFAFFVNDDTGNPFHLSTLPCSFRTVFRFQIDFLSAYLISNVHAGQQSVQYIRQFFFIRPDSNEFIGIDRRTAVCNRQSGLLSNGIKDFRQFHLPEIH